MRRVYYKLRSYEVVEVLFHLPYLYFALSVLFSQLAFNMMFVILIFLIFYITNSNFSVSILLFIFLIPQIVLSFIGGIVADVRDKKKILVQGNLLRAAALLVLFLNPKSTFLLYFISGVVSVITQFYVPAESPLIPKLVDKNRLVAANSIFGMGLFGSILVSYILAGPALTILGRSHVFLVLAALFVCAAIFAFLIPQEEKNVEDTGVAPQKLIASYKRSIVNELKESYLILRKTTKAGGAFFLLTLSQVIVLILATIVPGYAKSILGVPAEELSVLLFAPAALGMIVAAILIGSVFSRVDRDKLMTVGIFLSGVSLFLFPSLTTLESRSYIFLLNSLLPPFLEVNIFHTVTVLAFLAGVSNALVFIPSQTIIQELIPDNFRSKIYGLLFAMIGAFSLMPILVAGGLADTIGVGTVLVIVGFTLLLMGVARIQMVRTLFSVKK